MPKLVTVTEYAVRPSEPNDLQHRACIVFDVSELPTPDKLPDAIQGITSAPMWFATQSDAMTALGLTAPQGSVAPKSALTDDLNAFFSNGGQFGVYLFGFDPENPDVLFDWEVANHGHIYCYSASTKASADTMAALIKIATRFAGDSDRLFCFYNQFLSADDLKGLATAEPMNLKSLWTCAEWVPNTTGTLGIAAMSSFVSNAPTVLSPLAPMNFRALNGVVANGELGNQTIFAQLEALNGNFAARAVQAGLPLTCLFYGELSNNDPISGWYGADYVAILAEQMLAAELVQGSQPSRSPLVYDTMGITRLATKFKQALDNAVAVGCILPNYEMTVTPFQTYITQNPNDYGQEVYNGLSATITPIRGFRRLNIGLTVDFTGQSAATSITAAA